MLFWTDNYSEPKRIHIDRCKLGTPNFTSQTQLYVRDISTNNASVDYYPKGDLTHEHITVIKKSPPVPPVLEMNNNDYSLTEIASIVESNETKILSSYIISKPNSTNIEVTIKLNKQDITNIIKDFERHEYKVSASYKEEEADVDFIERYESLMRFLNP